MSRVPLAADDPSIPVPPFGTGSIPVTSVAPPARSIAEDDNTPVAFECIIPVPNPDSAIFPVVAPPNVRVCSFVVARFPAAVKYAPPVVPFPAEMEAVGVPELTLSTANFADALDCPPTNRSTVVLFANERSVVLIPECIDVPLV